MVKDCLNWSLTNDRYAASLERDCRNNNAGAMRHHFSVERQRGRSVTQPTCPPPRFHVHSTDGARRCRLFSGVLCRRRRGIHVDRRLVTESLLRQTKLIDCGPKKAIRFNYTANQQAQLSQTGRAMLRVIECFAKPFKVSQNNTLEYDILKSLLFHSNYVSIEYLF